MTDASGTSTALRAAVGGLWDVLRAPGLVLTLSAVTLATAVPFGVVLGSRLQTALAHQPPIALDAVEIDAEWWMEFRAQAQGLEATFTPTVLGLAAPLDSLSALADATPRPAVLAVPVVLYGVVWAFLWGGVLSRFDRKSRAGVRAFVASGFRYLRPFVVIAAGASAAAVALFLTVHPLLFGSIYDGLARMAASERDAFFWRVALYALFGSLLATVSLSADYARIAMVSAGARTASGGMASSLRFISRHVPRVAALSLLTGTLFVLVLAAYGLADTRVGGWRAVILGQAYVVARLAVRLTVAASELRLFKQLAGGARPDERGGHRRTCAQGRLSCLPQGERRARIDRTAGS